MSPRIREGGRHFGRINVVDDDKWVQSHSTAFQIRPHPLRCRKWIVFDDESPHRRSLSRVLGVFSRSFGNPTLGTVRSNATMRRRRRGDMT